MPPNVPGGEDNPIELTDSEDEASPKQPNPGPPTQPNPGPPAKKPRSGPKSTATAPQPNMPVAAPRPKKSVAAPQPNKSVKRKNDKDSDKDRKQPRPEMCPAAIQVKEDKRPRPSCAIPQLEIVNVAGLNPNCDPVAFMVGALHLGCGGKMKTGGNTTGGGMGDGAKGIAMSYTLFVACNMCLFTVKLMRGTYQVGPKTIESDDETFHLCTEGVSIDTKVRPTYNARAHMIEDPVARENAAANEAGYGMRELIQNWVDNLIGRGDGASLENISFYSLGSHAFLALCPTGDYLFYHGWLSEPEIRRVRTEHKLVFAHKDGYSVKASMFTAVERQEHELVAEKDGDIPRWLQDKQIQFLQRILSCAFFLAPYGEDKCVIGRKRPDSQLVPRPVRAGGQGWRAMDAGASTLVYTQHGVVREDDKVQQIWSFFMAWRHEHVDGLPVGLNVPVPLGTRDRLIPTVEGYMLYLLSKVLDQGGMIDYLMNMCSDWAVPEGAAGAFIKFLYCNSHDAQSGWSRDTIALRDLNQYARSGFLEGFLSRLYSSIFDGGALVKVIGIESHCKQINATLVHPYVYKLLWLFTDLNQDAAQKKEQQSHFAHNATVDLDRITYTDFCVDIQGCMPKLVAAGTIQRLYPDFAAAMSGKLREMRVKWDTLNAQLTERGLRQKAASDVLENMEDQLRSSEDELERMLKNPFCGYFRDKSGLLKETTMFPKDKPYAFVVTLANLRGYMAAINRLIARLLPCGIHMALDNLQFIVDTQDVDCDIEQATMEEKQAAEKKQKEAKEQEAKEAREQEAKEARQKEAKEQEAKQKEAKHSSSIFNAQLDPQYINLMGPVQPVDMSKKAVGNTSSVSPWLGQHGEQMLCVTGTRVPPPAVPWPKGQGDDLCVFRQAILIPCGSGGHTPSAVATFQLVANTHAPDGRVEKALSNPLCPSRSLSARIIGPEGAQLTHNNLGQLRISGPPGHYTLQLFGDAVQSKTNCDTDELPPGAGAMARRLFATPVSNIPIDSDPFAQLWCLQRSMLFLQKQEEVFQLQGFALVILSLLVPGQCSGHALVCAVRRTDGVSFILDLGPVISAPTAEPTQSGIAWLLVDFLDSNADKIADATMLEGEERTAKLKAIAEDYERAQGVESTMIKSCD